MRGQLEYGKYQHNGRLILEDYVIQLVERSKHLRLTFTQHELVLKLQHHFYRDSRFASYTQGSKTIEYLLIFLAQSEHIVNSSHTNRPEL